MSRNVKYSEHSNKIQSRTHLASQNLFWWLHQSAFNAKNKSQDFNQEMIECRKLTANKVVEASRVAQQIKLLSCRPANLNTFPWVKGEN